MSRLAPGLRRFENPVKFVRQLNVLMKATEVTQSALAVEAGMDRSRVNHYLRERRRPTLETMFRLDEAFSQIIFQRQRSSRRRRRA